MNTYKRIFDNFTGLYLEKASDEDRAVFQLKHDHSYDVFNNGVEICNSLDLEPVFSETIKIATLFHDTGRFPQYEKYKTFKDPVSCNHATTGVRYILRKKLLKSLSSKRLKTVLAAIALHNRCSIPESAPKHIKTAARVVRDADKIDILKVLLHDMANESSRNKTTLVGLPEIPEMISPAMMQSLHDKKQGIYSDMNCVNDFRLLLLSWAYDLNFKWSRLEMMKRNYIDNLFAQLAQTKEIKNLYAPIIEHLKG